MLEQEFFDIFDVCVNMEVMLVCFVIECGGDEWEVELLVCVYLFNKLELCEVSEYLFDEWDQCYQVFYIVIVVGCGLQYLLQMCEWLFDLVVCYCFIWLCIIVLLVEMLEDKYVQYQILVDVILVCDVEQVSVLMCEYLLILILII